MPSLVICEKPSQAKALRTALGTRFGDILPAAGHIVTLEEPEDVREDWKAWSTDLLWTGRFFGKKPAEGKTSYLNAIRQAARSADEIIIATDCDREGQLIGQEIVDFIGFRGRVRRAIFNAEDPQSLRTAFAQLHDNARFAGLYQSGQAREQADQVSNLSLTRAATVSLRAAGSKGAIGIGRVKTPVLGIVCRREEEILAFKPEDLFEVDAETVVAGGRLTLTCARLPGADPDRRSDEPTEGEELHADEEALAARETTDGRIRDRALAVALAAGAKDWSGPLRMRSASKTQAPPKLFDLTALQSAASARLGWSGEQTLKVAQRLYSEHTLITYPRGEAQHLPENNIPDVPRLVGALTGLKAFAPHKALLASPIVRKGKDGHFSDKALEGLAHYAIIPNVNTAERFATAVPGLDEDEARLFDMIARQYLAALAPDFEFRQTDAWIEVPHAGQSFTFRASGRVPLKPGWRAILGGGADEGPDFPPLKDGEPANVVQTRLRTVTTRPPARYTEGSLIRVMKEAWRLVAQPELRKRLKEAKGIGTPATRGDVVKGLLVQGQLQTKGKSLMPTDGGMLLYRTIRQVAPNLVDPGRTAAWETIFDAVERQQISAIDAVTRIAAETEKEIRKIAEASSVTIQIGKVGKPSDKMIAAARQIAQRKKIDLPKKVLTDGTACRAFLEEHLGPRPAPGAQEGEAGGLRAPSEKQIELARSLAERSGVPIPEGALHSARDLSAFIEQAMKTAPARPPSDKQIAFAEKLARDKGEALPEACRTDARACSAYIDKATAGLKRKRADQGGDRQ